MTPFQIALTLTTIFGVGFLVGALFQHMAGLKRRRELERGIDEVDRRAGVVKAEALEAAELLKKTADALARETERANTEERRRAEVVEMIKVGQDAANVWRDKFWASAIGQAAGLRLIGKEVLKLRTLLKQNNIDPGKSLAVEAISAYEKEFVAEIPPEVRQRAARHNDTEPVAKS